MNRNADSEHLELDEVLQLVWDALHHGVYDASKPFHHPALATTALDGGSSVRTVILRGVLADERKLICHTDSRSLKFAELQARPQAAWLFYDPAEKIQVRASGICFLHADDELADERWQASRPMSRRCYCSAHAPGTPSPHPTAGLPEPPGARGPVEAESAQGRANFAVVVSRVDLIDWLYLRARGHRRARFDWRGSQLSANWVTP